MSPAHVGAASVQLASTVSRLLATTSTRQTELLDESRGDTLVGRVVLGGEDAATGPSAHASDA